MEEPSAKAPVEIHDILDKAYLTVGIWWDGNVYLHVRKEWRDVSSGG